MESKDDIPRSTPYSLVLTSIGQHTIHGSITRSQITDKNTLRKNLQVAFIVMMTPHSQCYPCCYYEKYKDSVSYEDIST